MAGRILAIIITTILTITSMDIIMARHLFWLTAATLVAFTAPASAETVEDCDWRASTHSMAEPWEDNTRTFANGNVRLAVTDTIEPAAGAFHLVILSPPYDELGGRQCAVVSANGSIGFSGLTLDGMTSDYDPAIGLTFMIEAGAYDPETGGTIPQTLTVTLNQATGEITASTGGQQRGK